MINERGRGTRYKIVKIKIERIDISVYLKKMDALNFLCIDKIKK